MLKYFLALAGVAVIVVLYFNNPSTAGFFPKCPLKTATGLDCPGCGSQRALHQLLHLNVEQAFNYNPLLVLSIPYLAFAVWVERIRPHTDWSRKWRDRLMGPKAIWIIFSIVIAFFILRNIFSLTL